MSGKGRQARGTVQRDTQKQMESTKTKLAGRYPKMYTGKQFLEISPKIKAELKLYI